MNWRVVVVLPCLFLVACVTTPSGDLLMRDDDSQWVYGTGIGNTEHDARQSALRELATRILGQFKSTSSIKQTVQKGVSQTTSEAEFYSFTNVELELAQIDAVSREDGVVNVRLRIPVKTMQDLVERGKRKAATLSLFSQLESSPVPSATDAIRLAIAGLEQALEDDVLSERIKTKDRGIETFQQYFQFVARQKLQSLRLLVTPGKGATDKLVLTLVEMPTLMFQANVPVRVADKPLSTNGQGIILLSPAQLMQNVETPVAIDLDIRRLEQHKLLSNNDLKIDKILPPAVSSPAMTRVYLHAHYRNITTEVVVRIGGVARYDNVTVPSQILLSPGKSYVINVVDSDRNKPIAKQIHIPSTAADFYVSLPVEEKRYGKVSLQVASHSATIAVMGPGGQIKEQGRLEQQRIETGRYEVIVSQEGRHDYQKIIDNITVLPGRTVERKYRAPRDREYYNFGYQLSASIWHFGREPASSYKLPGNTTYGDLQSSADVTMEHCTGPVAEGRYLTNMANMMFQGHLGILWCDSGSGGSGSSDVSANIYTSGVGAGFYKKTDKKLYWLSAGLSQESISWDREKSRLTGLSRGSAKNTYPFIELGAMFSAFEVRLRVPAGTLSPELSIGFGFHRMKQGFRYPASTPPY